MTKPMPSDLGRVEPRVPRLAAERFEMDDVEATMDRLRQLQHVVRAAAAPAARVECLAPAGLSGGHLDLAR
jgi:hypothetical protein